MAACARRSTELFSSLRVFREIKRHHERCFSSSVVHCAASESSQPPKFTPPTKPLIVDKTQTEASLREFLSPEFIPPRQRTNRLKYAAERKDMIQRRKVLNIPEFYVGSILAVTSLNPHGGGSTNYFVGICTQRSGHGLGATFVLRNVIDGQGVEVCFELYNPRVKQIDVLKLEKRLDENLMYLRDALPVYSTISFDMKPVPHSPTGSVHINKLKVRMRPKPWSKRWERPKFNIQGIRFDLCLTPEQLEHAQKWAKPWREYDMLQEYDTSSLEKEILEEVQKEQAK